MHNRMRSIQIDQNEKIGKGLKSTPTKRERVSKYMYVFMYLCETREFKCHTRAKTK